MSFHTFSGLAALFSTGSVPVVVIHFAAALLASTRREIGVGNKNSFTGTTTVFTQRWNIFHPGEPSVLFRAETIQLRGEELLPPPPLSCDEVESRGTNSGSRLSISVTPALGVPSPSVQSHSTALRTDTSHLPCRHLLVTSVFGPFWGR